MIRRQLGIFLLVGFSTVAVDFVVYHALLWLGMPVSIAKLLGFLTGTVFAYFANRRWTFQGSQPAGAQVLRFATLYGGTLACNVGVNAAMLRIAAHVFDSPGMGINLAFCVATGVSAALNFIGMKWWVFRTAPVNQATPNHGV